jgi:hypothetical protein
MNYQQLIYLGACCLGEILVALVLAIAALIKAIRRRL